VLVEQDQELIQVLEDHFQFLVQLFQQVVVEVYPLLQVVLQRVDQVDQVEEVVVLQVELEQVILLQLVLLKEIMVVRLQDQ
jgi:hypothetical protein|tara:strand:- start:326 stop:568 length:243 start_codon:yes stop_codon:yes gene_type:complete